MDGVPEKPEDVSSKLRRACFRAFAAVRCSGSRRSIIWVADMRSCRGALEVSYLVSRFPGTQRRLLLGPSILPFQGKGLQTDVQKASVGARISEIKYLGMLYCRQALTEHLGQAIEKQEPSVDEGKGKELFGYADAVVEYSDDIFILLQRRWEDFYLERISPLGSEDVVEILEGGLLGRSFIGLAVLVMLLRLLLLKGCGGGRKRRGHWSGSIFCRHEWERQPSATSPMKRRNRTEEEVREEQ